MAPSEVADRRLAGLRLLYRPPPPTQESRDRDPAAGSHRPDGSPADRRAESMTATTGQAAPDDKLQAAFSTSSSTRAIGPNMCAVFAWPLWSATGLENVACSARTSGSDSTSPERQSGKSTDASMSHSLSYSSWRRSQLMGWSPSSRPLGARSRIA